MGHPSMGIGSWTEPETRWSAEAFEALLDWHKESKPKEAALQISPKYNWLPIFATTSRKISPNSLILGGPGNCETFPSTPHSERVGYMRKVLHLSLLINYNNVLIHWPCGDFILFSTTDRSEARVGYNTAGGGGCLESRANACPQIYKTWWSLAKWSAALTVI